MSRGVTNRRYITSWDENGLAVDSVLDSLERKFILKEEQRLALHSFITTKKDVLALLPTGFLSLYIRHLV